MRIALLADLESKPLRPANGSDPMTGTFGALAAGTVALGLTAQIIATEAGFGAAFVASSLAFYGAVALVVVRGVRRHHPHGRFGLANMITLVRVVLVALMTGVTVELFNDTPSTMQWLLFVLAFSAMALDGLDGIVARGLGTASPFGARFDMEIDALQILVLCAAAIALGKAGAWVLASGLMRYVFVAAGALWPMFAAPIPFSWRRKAVAVIQGGTLTALMAPAVVPPASAWLAAIALAVLAYSFAYDVRWLMMARQK